MKVFSFVLTTWENSRDFFQGLNIALANKNTDFDEYISVVPTSAFLGDGIGNLMAHIVEQCQARHAARLSFSDELECIVMEVVGAVGL